MPSTAAYGTAILIPVSAHAPSTLVAVVPGHVTKNADGSCGAAVNSVSPAATPGSSAALAAEEKKADDEHAAKVRQAMQLFQENKLHEAEMEFRTLLDHDDSYAAAYYHAGQALEKLGDLEQARTMYEKGIEVTTRKGDLHIEICSACHPFFTGKQKLIDTAGRVDRFNRRYGKKTPEAEATPAQ